MEECLATSLMLSDRLYQNLPQSGRGGPRVGLLGAGTAGEGDAVAIVCYQPAVLDGTTTQIAGQIGHYPSPMAVAFHDPHVPLRLPRVAQAVQEVEQLLRTHRLEKGKRPVCQGVADGREHLAPKHRHDDPRREDKGVPDGRPVCRRGPPPTGDQTVDVPMEHEGLAPRV